ncbi:MAG: ABC transporter transmembrane domain-containing protein, partial [Chloroflexota bacterium]|nr:ABC transporter transmembrane domain-containing protein [Chloroflexota bacterium]
MLERIAQLPEERAINTSQVAQRLWDYIKPEWKLLLGMLVMLTLTAIGQGGGPALIGVAVDQYITEGDRAGLHQTMLLLLGVYAFGLVGFIGQAWFIGVVSQRVLKRLRLDIFEHVQRLSLRYFDRHEAGDLMSRLVNDTEVVGSTLSQGMAQALGAIFGLVGILVGMFLLNWQLAIAAFLMIPVMYVTTRVFSRRARAAFRVTRET